MGCGGSAPKVKVVFVVGGPGSGKGTQCKKIVEKYGFKHLSTGDILRNVVKKQENKKWQELKDKMDKGEFVSTPELLGFVKDEFSMLGECKVLLDGFPRNQENVNLWNREMGDIAELAGILYFECSTEEMKSRMLGRNEGRSDDNEETMVKRIENFEKETIPVIAAYEGSGKLMKIDASKAMEEVFEQVVSAFDMKKI